MMKNRLLSLLLLVCVVLGVCAGCTTEKPLGPRVDYAGQATLDMETTATIKEEVTVKQYVDGDTTHFNFSNRADLPANAQPSGFLKARYMAVNTPESTGTIEPWGKTAANYTKEKLQDAESIILETDKASWDADSTGERYLVWVWYKTEGTDVYRNLNLELLQEGLAIASKTDDCRYASLCTPAISQARAHALHVYSKEADPDFYYGEALEIDLKELRTNVETYKDKRVAFNATVTQYHDWNVYVEDYDEVSDMYYGISVFYGYDSTFHDILKTGNRVRIVGKVSYFEAGGTYQISDIKYDKMDPTNADYTQALETGKTASYKATTYETLMGKKTVDLSGEDASSKEFDYAFLAMNTSVQMNNLEVISVYTTKTGDNTGAISITCRAPNGQIFTVRTTVLKDSTKAPVVPSEYKDANNVVLETFFVGKTFDVKGIVDYFDGEYQIKVFSIKNFTFHS